MAERWELQTEDRIQAARKKVAAAKTEYRKGGSPAAVNKAERELADAHWQWRVVNGGRNPADDR